MGRPSLIVELARRDSSIPSRCHVRYVGFEATGHVSDIQLTNQTRTSVAVDFRIGMLT